MFPALTFPKLQCNRLDLKKMYIYIYNRVIISYIAILHYAPIFYIIL